MPRPKPAKLLKLFAVILFSALWVYCSAILTILGSGTMLPWIVIALGLLGLAMRKRKIRWGFGAGALLCIAIVGVRAARSPSNDRVWEEHLSTAPSVSIEGDTITIEGVRNFEWNADGSFTPAWETRTYELSNLQGVDLLLEPFGPADLMAHSMLSFDFAHEGRLLLSIEARREQGEEYGIVPGGLNNFELIYILQTEQDGIGQRAHRGHNMYAFPIKNNPLRLRAFFLALCSTTNHLQHTPRFYRVVRDNCTTAWIQHADHLSNKPLGLQLDTILTGRVAHMLHNLRFIETDLPYKEMMEHFRIDHLVIEALEHEDFSTRIRAHRAPAGPRGT